MRYFRRCHSLSLSFLAVLRARFASSLIPMLATAMLPSGGQPRSPHKRIGQNS